MLVTRQAVHSIIERNHLNIYPFCEDSARLADGIPLRPSRPCMWTTDRHAGNRAGSAAAQTKQALNAARSRLRSAQETHTSPTDILASAAQPVSRPVTPPSIRRIAPVVKLEAGLARYSAAPTISLG
jgi:hypothetical protein